MSSCRPWLPSPERTGCTVPPFTSIAEHRERGMAYESIPGLLAQSRGDGHFHRSSRGSRGGARCASHHFMCNPYSITTNQAAIIGSTARSATRRRCRAYFRTTLPQSSATPTRAPRIVTMRWGMPPPPSEPGPPVTNIRRTGAAGSSPRTAALGTASGLWFPDDRGERRRQADPSHASPMRLSYEQEAEADCDR